MTPLRIDFEEAFFTQLKVTFYIIVIPAAVMVAFFVFDTFSLGSATEHCGLRPRSAEGLLGIVCSPFVHKSLPHLVSNLVGWFGLAMCFASYGTRTFIHGTMYIVITAGFALWIFGRDMRHLGCSGILFGYLGFLVTSLVLERPVSLRSILAVFASLFLYGGSLFSFGFFTSGVSYEGHLFGLVSGVLYAMLLFREGNMQEFGPLLGSARAIENKALAMVV